MQQIRGRFEYCCTRVRSLNDGLRGATAVIRVVNKASGIASGGYCRHAVMLSQPKAMKTPTLAIPYKPWRIAKRMRSVAVFDDRRKIGNRERIHSFQIASLHLKKDYGPLFHRTIGILISAAMPCGSSRAAHCSVRHLASHKLALGRRHGFRLRSRYHLNMPLWLQTCSVIKKIIYRPCV